MNSPLGYVATLLQREPGLDRRTITEGSDAFRAGVALVDNPYTTDGLYGWWRDGWFMSSEK